MNDSDTYHEQHRMMADSSLLVTTAEGANNRFKGFSTSISDLFHSSDPLHKEDCCAFACCGILAHDKSQFLMARHFSEEQDGNTENLLPTSSSLSSSISSTSHLMNSIVTFIVVPITMIVALVLSAVYINDQQTNDDVTSFILVSLILYLAIMTCKHRYDRVKFRRSLAELSANRLNRSTAASLASYQRQGCCDAHCAHVTCCGCYSRDDDFALVGTDNRSSVLPLSNEQQRHKEDFCSMLWKSFSIICCGALFRCWFQCCGCCATAQETREVRMLLPSQAQNLDHVTYEPYDTYFPRIHQLRTTKNRSLIQHYRALSQLSQLLLKALLLVVVLLSLLAFIGQGAQQVQQQQQQNDDSSSSSSPFAFANLLVFITTFLQAFFILYFVHWKWNRFDLSLDAVVKYFASGFLLTTGLALFFEMVVSTVLQLILSFVALFAVGSADQQAAAANGNPADGQSIMDQLSKDHLMIVVLFLMLNAYAVAALVEELCKYFGYWMADHPDFLSLPVNSGNRNQRVNGNSAATDYSATGTPGSSSNALQGFSMRSYTSLGSAITIAMVAVSLGFACCENLIYIFVYARGGVEAEFAVLLMRSMFPVHPLAAAIQSIGVCKRELEGIESHSIGRIILPAVLLHGTFDFSLMLMGVIGGNGSNDNGENGNDENSASLLYLSLISFGVSIFVVAIGLCYYIKESRAQRARLAILDSGMQTDATRLV